MLTKSFGLLLSLVVATAYAQDDTGRGPASTDDGSADAGGGGNSKTPLALPPEEKDTDIAGSIADTNLTRILESREVLKPEFGFEDIFMTRGSSEVLDLQNLPGYGRKDILFFYTTEGIITGSRQDPSGGERVQAGQTPGSTQIMIYERVKEGGKNSKGKLLKVYRITITNEDLITLMQEIRALIGDVEGLDIRIVGTQVVIDGNVLVPKDMRRVLAVTGRYIGQNRPVVNLAEISPLTMKLLGEKMEEEIAGGKDRPRDIKVKFLNGRFFLEGSVDTGWQRTEAERICQAFITERYTLEPKDGSGKLETPKFSGLGECVSMIRQRAGQPAEPDPILAVRIDFVTLNRNYSKLFNFRWAPGLSTQGAAQYSTDVGKLVSSFAATIGNLFPMLDTASSHGYARILKTATLLVRDGEKAGDRGSPPEATINETLQIYTLIPGETDKPATYQPVNVSTNVSVKAKSVPGTDKINMDVLAKQSELKDPGKPGGSGPTIYMSDVKTSIVVSNGESAALGGLVTERRNVSFVRDPANATDPQTERPYDFNLFEVGRSHSFGDDKSQFIIFVTPTKLRNPTEGTEQLKRKFRLRK